MIRVNIEYPTFFFYQVCFEDPQQLVIPHNNSLVCVRSRSQIDQDIESLQDDVFLVDNIHKFGFKNTSECVNTESLDDKLDIAFPATRYIADQVECLFLDIDFCVVCQTASTVGEGRGR